MNPTPPATSFDAAGIAPAPITEVHPMYWSIRRELFENRFLYIAPLVVTAVVLFGSVITMITLPYRKQALDDARQIVLMAKPFRIAPAPIMLSTFLIAMFYCLDALYGERRDRSILFWKSLPVSDRTTVLSKAIIPFGVLPLIAFALSVASQVVLLFVSTAVTIGSGMSPLALWRELQFIEGLPIMLYGLTVHALWFAPIYGWFLLVSAWSRRAPFLWALLPLLAVSALERITFNTSHFMTMLQYRVGGAMKEAFAFKQGAAGHVDRISQLEPLRFLSAPGLWAGLLFAAACLFMAVRLRRDREPI